MHSQGQLLLLRTFHLYVIVISLLAVWKLPWPFAAGWKLSRLYIRPVGAAWNLSHLQS